MNRSVIHILQPTDGGVPHYVAALARFQSDAGWRVEVAAPASGPSRDRLVEADVIYLPWEATRDPGRHMLAEVVGLRRLLADSDAGIVHLHSAKAGVAGRLALRGARATVFQPHSWTFEAAPRAKTIMVAWERLAARWCDRIICVSEGEREAGRAVGIRAAFAVVPNGVDLREWRVPSDDERAEARRRLGISPAAPLVVSVGRVRWQKGHDVLLDAWPVVLSHVPDARLVVVGDGPERSRLMERGQRGVTFVGEVPDTRDWIVAADVVALPSRYEGMSLAMLEAMATATSVVTTAVAGAREAMGDESGAIVPVEDGDALARAITDRLADRDLAQREGRAGRARVERRHSFDTSAKKVSLVYESVLRERP